MNQFRSMLPRLADLYDRFVTGNVDNFFHGFPNRLRSQDPVTFKFYSKVESWLSFVPAVEWDYYAQKVGQTVLLCDRPRKRFWEQLHDVLNEALGVKVLRSEFGCDIVRFVRPTTGSRIPDLFGQNTSIKHYLEVKTVNHSQDERESWYRDENPTHSEKMPKRLKAKIKSSYFEALSQLRSPNDSASARKIVLLVLNPDYSFDPVDIPVADVVYSYLASIEQSDFPIHCHIYS
jgi:hypothetical protein